MLSPTFGPEADARLAAARVALAELRDALVRFGATPDDHDRLIQSIAQLDDVFLLVVVGEFNSGKSAFINALAGTPALREGVTPTTATLQLLEFGESAGEHRRADGTLVVSAPAPVLRHLHIVDTPGTNAILREHERLTTEFVPRADLVLFVTSAERPFTETERALMDAIRRWGKKIVLVVNKIDILERPQEVEDVVAFVEHAAKSLLGSRPDVFPVSARLAQRAKHGEPALWGASRFDALEQFIRTTLDEEGRFALKLANPLGVGQVLAERYTRIARERLALLSGDLAVIDDIDRQLGSYRVDLHQGFDLRMVGIRKTLLAMELRGHEYFEDTLRLARVPDLLNRARIQKEFEDRVVADTPARVEQQVNAIIDWLVEQELVQWQAIRARLATRASASGETGAPDIGTFHADRAQLIASLGGQAQRVVDTYDRHAESAAIADQARAAVTTAAAVGAGALGLGALVTVAASTAAADVTGLLMASVMAVIGLLIIPARRRRAKADIAAKLSTLTRTLQEALQHEFTRAEQRSTDRMTTTIAPYRRFVRTEQARWSEANERFRTLGEVCAKLKSGERPLGGRPH